MEGERWEVVDEGWEVEDEGWEVEDEGWKVEGERWEVEGEGSGESVRGVLSSELTQSLR